MRSTGNRTLRWGIIILALVIVMALFVPVAQPGEAQSTMGCVAAPPGTQVGLPAEQSPHAPTPYAGFSSPANALEITADRFGAPPANDELAHLYTKTSIRLISGESIQFSATIPADAMYTIAFDHATPVDFTVSELSLRVDNALPAPEFGRLILPVFYRGVSDVFPKDRYGNDALIPQVRDLRWTTSAARNAHFGDTYPLQLSLSAGEHQFRLMMINGAAYLGSVYLVPFAPYPTYEQYRAAHTGGDVPSFSVVLEAELPAFKNDTSIRPTTSRSMTVTPYDTYCLLLNIMGGTANNWIKSGGTVYYEVEVPQDGYYALTLRQLQNLRTSFTVFRRITVNGVVPFEPFNAVPFPYTADWTNVTLGSGGEPYRVYLHAGVNVIGIEATHAPYQAAVETIQAALLDINTLALEIQRLTGNRRDRFRDWQITSYIPDIEMRLNAIIERLEDDQALLLSIDSSESSPELLTYRMAIENLRFLANDPDIIPVYLSRFSEGTGSAAQQLGSLLPLLQNQPLTLDKLYVHSPDQPPAVPTVSLGTALLEDVRRFIYSFQPDPYLAAAEGGADELEVWVNRPRQYVNLLQWMADTQFTPETGIRVKFSIMPDESKLILANAAGIQPDVALGVSTDRPFELAIRGALYDLRTLPGFNQFIRHYSPGSLLGYIINDSIYAIPETQDFWVTFYRRDIMESLGLPVPDTWDEVIEILPELQRYGMNYNTPLSGGTGVRGLLFTAPYIFNAGADLYSEGGFATGLESDAAVEGIRFMAESFTLYGMPLSTVSFFDSFRYGRLPIGITNAATYIQLGFAAPELGGLWSIAPYPATILADGTENRWTTGSAQTCIMFANTDMPEEGWHFLQWWMSTETQIAFQDQVLLNFGREYLWFSANLEALAELDIPEEHRAVLLEQARWVREPVRLPGSYMQERELSNIWTRIVFDGVNPRVAIDRSVTIINREIERKMEEFGYLVDGERAREFRIPTMDTVLAWMEDAD